MLEGDVAAIPDLCVQHRFPRCPILPSSARDCSSIVRREASCSSARQRRRITFTENVFYRFADGKVETVWSVIDQAAIKAQLLTLLHHVVDQCRP